MKAIVTALAVVIALVASLGVADATYRVDRVHAFDTNVYSFVFSCGVTTHITLQGDGDTDLDARLFDEFGNLIDVDLRRDDFCSLWVTPSWTGVFYLEVRNLGNVYNEYELAVR